MESNLGFHFCPSNQHLLDCLLHKVNETIEESLVPGAHWPIQDQQLYSSEPWNVFSNNDPWEVDYSTEEKGYVERTIYAYVKLRKIGKRFIRTAGSGVWDGSTGYVPVKGDQKKGPILGLKACFNFRVKKNDDTGVANSYLYGEWRMNEFKLGGKIVKDLDEGHLAKVLVLCQITQRVDTKSACYLSWPKRILDIYLEMLDPYGVFDPEKEEEVVKEDGTEARNIDGKRGMQPLMASDEYSNKKQRVELCESSSDHVMNEAEQKEYADELDQFLQE